MPPQSFPATAAAVRFSGVPTARGSVRDSVRGRIPESARGVASGAWNPARGAHPPSRIWANSMTTAAEAMYFTRILSNFIQKSQKKPYLCRRVGKTPPESLRFLAEMPLQGVLRERFRPDKDR